MADHMEKAVRYQERRLHKTLILVLKIIPMLLALSAMLNMLCDFLGINGFILSYIGGISLFPLMFIYLASYVFKFCEYHRMFLHYVVVVNIINCVDHYVGIPVSTATFFAIHLILICFLLFLVLYFHRREKCCRQ